MPTGLTWTCEACDVNGQLGELALGADDAARFGKILDELPLDDRAFVLSQCKGLVERAHEERDRAFENLLAQARVDRDKAQQEAALYESSAETERRRARQQSEFREHSDRQLVAHSKALARIASAIGEPGLESDPALCAARACERLESAVQAAVELAIKVPAAMQRAITAVAAARLKVDAKHGAKSLSKGRAATDPLKALGVLAEEQLELTREVLDHGGEERILEEAIDVAQVALAWIEALLRAGYGQHLEAAIQAERRAA